MAMWPTPQKDEMPGPNREYRSTTNAYRGGKKVQPMLCDVAAMSESQLSDLTCSSADFLVKTSARPASVPVWRGPGLGSGRSLPDSLASYDRELRSWRTCQGSLLSASTPFSGTWPRSGMTRSGRLYAHRMLAHRTAGSGCSFWPTPQNYSKGDEANHPPGLTPLDLAARPEMSASIQERKRKGQDAWPTPDARDRVGNGPDDRWHREVVVGEAPDGTYELIGPKINGNAEHCSGHTLMCHGNIRYENAPRTFEALKAWLAEIQIEGLVWHHLDGRMVKIKARDFGLPWPITERK